MTPKQLYIALCFPGLLLPYVQFLPFLREHDSSVRLFFQQLFANPVSGSFALDVILSSIVLWFFVFIEGRRLGMRRLWLPIAANIVGGVSFALPLFLWMRETQLERSGLARMRPDL
jgi:uncharacterized protein DUF2834